MLALELSGQGPAVAATSDLDVDRAGDTKLERPVCLHPEQVKRAAASTIVATLPEHGHLGHVLHVLLRFGAGLREGRHVMTVTLFAKPASPVRKECVFRLVMRASDHLVDIAVTATSGRCELRGVALRRVVLLIVVAISGLLVVLLHGRERLLPCAVVVRLLVVVPLLMRDVVERDLRADVLMIVHTGAVHVQSIVV